MQISATFLILTSDLIRLSKNVAYIVKSFCQTNLTPLLHNKNLGEIISGVYFSLNSFCVRITDTTKQSQTTAEFA